jgi:hypothetical protein
MADIPSADQATVTADWRCAMQGRSDERNIISCGAPISGAAARGTKVGRDARPALRAPLQESKPWPIRCRTDLFAAESKKSAALSTAITQQILIVAQPFVTGRVCGLTGAHDSQRESTLPWCFASKDFESKQINPKPTPRLLLGAGGRNRTDTPFGNGILSAARLPVPPRPRSCRHSCANRSRWDGMDVERPGGLSSFCQNL